MIISSKNKKRCIIFLIILSSVVTGFILLSIGIGLTTPSIFRGTIHGTITASRADVWAELINLDHIPARHKEITSVELVNTTDQGYRQWKENTDLGGYIIFETIDEISQEKLVNKMDASSFGMTGTWTYVLEDLTPSSTELTIQEESVINNIFLRALFTIVGRDKNLRQELRSFQINR